MATNAAELPPQLRRLVFQLQVCGLFPYRVSESRFRFSIPLFLWGICLLLLSVNVEVIIYDKVVRFSVEDLHNIGGLAVTFTFTSFLVGTYLSNAFMLFRSKTMVHILTEVTLIFRTTPSAKSTIDSLLRYIISSLIKWLTLTVTAVYVVNSISANKAHVSEQIFIDIQMTLLASAFLTRFQVLKETMYMLGQVIKCSTKETIEQEAFLSLIGVRSKWASDFPPHLHRLQNIYYQVWNTKETILPHFMMLFTMSIVCSSCIVICMVYAIATKSVSYLPAFVIFGYCTSYLLSICRVGQVFSDQVHDAVWTLQQAECSTTNFEAKRQLAYVATKLEPFKKFDACGWYTLGNNTLVSIFNLVMTYLVILLQVGSQPVKDQNI